MRPACGACTETMTLAVAACLVAAGSDCKWDKKIRSKVLASVAMGNRSGWAAWATAFSIARSAVFATRVAAARNLASSNSVVWNMVISFISTFPFQEDILVTTVRIPNSLATQDCLFLLIGVYPLSAFIGISFHSD